MGSYDPPATAGRSRIFDVDVTVVSSPLEQADIVTVDEHVQEARHAVSLEHAGAQSRELHDERVERLADGARLDVDEPLPAGVRAQHGWDADLGHCFKRYSKGGSST